MSTQVSTVRVGCSAQFANIWLFTSVSVGVILQLCGCKIPFAAHFALVWFQLVRHMHRPRVPDHVHGRKYFSAVGAWAETVDTLFVLAQSCFGGKDGGALVTSQLLGAVGALHVSSHVHLADCHPADCADCGSVLATHF